MTSEDGDKLVLIMEGRLNREKLMQLADFLELYAGATQSGRADYIYENSKLAKLSRVISQYFPFSYFSSRDAVEAYMTEYREPLSLSTASTYLARLADRGFLEKKGSGNSIRYRLLRPKSKRVESIGEELL